MPPPKIHQGASDLALGESVLLEQKDGVVHGHQADARPRVATDAQLEVLARRVVSLLAVHAQLINECI